MKPLPTTALLLVLAAAGCSREAGPSAPATGSAELVSQARHLLLTLELGRDGLRVASAREVALPLPGFKAAPREPWMLELLDAQGRSLWSAPIPAASQLRGEFADDSGGLEGVHVTVDQPAFAVRIPILAAAASLRLEGEAWTLPEGDPRRAGLAPEARVELGRAALRGGRP